MMPSGLQTSAPRSTTSGGGTSTPYSGLPLGRPDASARLHLLVQHVVHRTGALKTQTSLRNAKRCSPGFIPRFASTRHRAVNGQAEEKWHQWISLFAAFSLPDDVSHPCCVFPQSICGLGVRSADKRQQSSQTWDQDVVIRPNAVDGRHCGCRVCVSESCDCMSDAISSSPGWQSELKRRTKFPPPVCSIGATDLLFEVPVAIHLTRSWGFCSAVIGADKIATRVPSGTSSRAKSSAALKSVQKHPPHLVAAPSRSWGPARRSVLQTFGAQVEIQLQATFGDESENGGKYLSHPWQLIECRLRPRSQTRSNQLLSCTGHLSPPHLLLPLHSALTCPASALDCLACATQQL